jgi:hemoglobin
MTSLYERLGGAAAIGAAVDIFYTKVLADAALAPFFTGVDMPKQRAHQAMMLAAAFGGPNEYRGRDLGTAHARLVADGMGDLHFDRVVGHLGATLAELGVAPELVSEAAAVAESVRGVVLGRA